MEELDIKMEVDDSSPMEESDQHCITEEIDLGVNLKEEYFTVKEEPQTFIYPDPNLQKLTSAIVYTTKIDDMSIIMERGIMYDLEYNVLLNKIEKKSKPKHDYRRAVIYKKKQSIQRYYVMQEKLKLSLQLFRERKKKQCHMPQTINLINLCRPCSVVLERLELPQINHESLDEIEDNVPLSDFFVKTEENQDENLIEMPVSSTSKTSNVISRPLQRRTLKNINNCCLYFQDNYFNNTIVSIINNEGNTTIYFKFLKQDCDSNNLIFIDATVPLRTFKSCCWYRLNIDLKEIWEKYFQNVEKKSLPFLTKPHRCRPMQCICCCRKNKIASYTIVIKSCKQELVSLSSKNLVPICSRIPRNLIKPKSNIVPIKATTKTIKNIISMKNIEALQQEFYIIDENENVREYYIVLFASKFPNILNLMENASSVMTKNVMHHNIICCWAKREKTVNISAKTISAPAVTYIKRFHACSPQNCECCCRDNSDKKPVKRTALKLKQLELPTLPNHSVQNRLFILNKLKKNPDAFREPARKLGNLAKCKRKATKPRAEKKLQQKRNTITKSVEETQIANSLMLEHPLILAERPSGSTLAATPSGPTLAATPNGSILAATLSGSTLAATQSDSILAAIPSGSTLAITPSGSILAVRLSGSTLAATPSGSILAAIPSGSILPATPRVPTLAATPSGSTLAAIPSSSTLAATPSGFTFTATPSDFTLAATLSASTHVATPSGSTLAATPSAPTHVAKPSGSTLAATPSASTHVATPCGSTLAATPSAPTHVAKPSGSTLAATPSASTHVATPSGSTLAATPSAPTHVAKPSGSTLAATPSASTHVATPSGSTLAATSSGSTLATTPSGSNLTATLSGSNLSSKPSSSTFIAKPSKQSKPRNTTVSAKSSNFTVAKKNVKRDTPKTTVKSSLPKIKKVQQIENPTLNNVETQILPDSLKDTILTVCDNRKVAATLQVPVTSLSTEELHILSTIMMKAQEQIDTLALAPKTIFSLKIPPPPSPPPELNKKSDKSFIYKSFTAAAALRSQTYKACFFDSNVINPKVLKATEAKPMTKSVYSLNTKSQERFDTSLPGPSGIQQSKPLDNNVRTTSNGILMPLLPLSPGIQLADQNIDDDPYDVIVYEAEHSGCEDEEAILGP